MVTGSKLGAYVIFLFSSRMLLGLTTMVVPLRCPTTQSKYDVQWLNA